MRQRGAILLFLAALAAQAQSPIGDPFPINEYTTGDQVSADVASQPGGSFVVVWQSEGADGDGLSIRGRRFSGQGKPLSGEFGVNATTAGNQFRPSVAADELGNFVVAWSSPDADGTGVFARLFDAAGTSLGPDFQINDQTLGSQGSPDVSRNAAGQFVVSWRDFSNDKVMASTFDAAGGTDLPDFVVNASTSFPAAGDVAVGLRSDGGFAVAWIGEHDVGGFPARDTIQKRFAANGSQLSGEFQLSQPGPYGVYLSYRPEVEVDRDDNFIVVWHDSLNLAWGGAFARRTSAAGVTEPLRELALESLGHTVSMAPGGEFVVAWRDYWTYDLIGARFDASGDEVSSFFVTSDDFPSGQAHLGDNPSEFVVVHTVGDLDPDLEGRLFDDTVFTDGFESGDTSAWSATVP